MQPAESVPLVGRGAECARIESWLRDPGDRPVMEVVGEPGIGKTRLLAELVDRARRHGWRVLSGQASESERTSPFGVLVDALDDHLAGLSGAGRRAVAGDDAAALGEVFPAFGAGPTGRPVGRYRLHGAVRAVLERLAVPVGAVVVLDDLHWADDATVELLAHLFRRRPRAPVRIAVAYRPRQATARLRAVLALCPAPVSVSPRPLTAAEADEVLGRDLADAPRRRIYAESGGNPFYLRALARAARSGRPGESTIDSADGDLPATVRRALSGEFGALSSPARRLAWAAAVVGDPFDVELTATVARVDTAAALDGVDELVARDLVRPADGGRRFRFRHPLLTAMSYQDAGPGWRLGAHARAAAALRRSGAAPDALAPHIQRTAHRGDRAALDTLTSAARITVGRAPLLAAHWLRCALRLLPDPTAPAEPTEPTEPAEPTEAAEPAEPAEPVAGDGRPVPAAAADAERLDLLGELARALCLAGDLRSSRAVAHELLRLFPAGPTRRRARAVTFCAMVERLLGNHSAARALLLAELAAAPRARTPEAAALQLELATGSMMRSDFAANAQWAHRALEIADAHGDRPVQIRAGCFLAMSSLVRRDTAAAAAYLDRAALLVDGLPDGLLADCVESVLWLAWTEVSLGRYPAAVRHLRRGIAVAGAGGQAHLTPLLLSCQVMALRWLGRLPEAVACGEQAVDAAGLSGSAELRTVALATYAWVASWVGDVAAARAAAAEAVRVARPLEGWFRGVAAGMLGGSRADDDPDGWVDLIVAGFGGPGLPAVDTWSRISWSEVLVRAELGRGRIDAAADWATRAAASAAGLDHTAADGLVLLAEAQVAAARDDRATAAARALRAAELFTRAGCRLDAARAYLVAGATATERDAARDALHSAHLLFAECGAEDFARRARRARRRLDARGSRRPHPDPDTLTGREAQVATLVAEGLSNREVARRLGVSPKTVEMHLGRVFAKLGIASRAALASTIVRAGQ